MKPIIYLTVGLINLTNLCCRSNGPGVELNEPGGYDPPPPTSMVTFFAVGWSTQCDSVQAFLSIGGSTQEIVIDKQLNIAFEDTAYQVSQTYYCAKMVLSDKDVVYATLKIHAHATGDRATHPYVAVGVAQNDSSTYHRLNDLLSMKYRAGVSNFINVDTTIVFRIYK